MMAFHKRYSSQIALLLLLLTTSTSQSFEWEDATPEQVGMVKPVLEQARDYALTGGGSGCITRGGKRVMSWGDQSKRYDIKSSTKSIGVTALGLAINDGIMNLDDKAQEHYSDVGVPPNESDKRLADITIKHLATMTAGFEKPGGFEKLAFTPGTKWGYTDGGANWLADCLTVAYGQDMKAFLFERVFTPLGITSSDLAWRNNAYRPDTINGIKRYEFGSGININVDAMAKIGYLYLRRGCLGNQQIIPESFVDMVSKPVPGVKGLPVEDWTTWGASKASNHYGLLWWNNADGSLSGVPRDAYWSFGLHDSLIVVIPSLDIVIARAGSDWSGSRHPSYYHVINPFLLYVAQSVSYSAPYPQSEKITSLTWAPASSVVRKAEGSDTFPMTWADDGNLYTSFADGWGFAPMVPDKLSMGFAKIVGPATDFTGVNIRSDDEQYGGGSSGKKASGMLMVEDVLYMWVRNANNDGKYCELWWSKDHAENWEKADWQFEEFGYCTFINYGQNYSGARDNYVYTVTPDGPSAYDNYDRFVLMRVPKNRVTKREAYEFFAGLDVNDEPTWSTDIDQRASVFDEPERCYRSGISYNAGIGRYLWWQLKMPTDEGMTARYDGRLGVFDAPEPWGPWTTVYYMEALPWDMGSGETGSFPTKWMSEDGRTIYLVFSGNDSFSVRKANLTVLMH
jgi:CubicO group peptidase (beta-lactamase class C family)